jgi:hypothetical protein
MTEVIPLKYGAMFKRLFSEPAFFNQFAKDILGINLNVSKVHTEYEYPKPVGFVRSKYDLFAEDEEQRIIVEIQQVKEVFRQKFRGAKLLPEKDFFDRFLYYHIISMAEQVGGFDEYAFDRTVYTIVVLTSVPRDGSVKFSCAISDMSPVDEWGNKVPVYPHRIVFLVPRLVNKQTPPVVRKWLNFISDSLDGSIDESGYDEAPFQQMIKAIETQTIDPEVLSEIKDEAAWEKAKARFAKEGREEGLEQGLEQGRKEGEKQLLAQQRQTVIAAQKMGMEIKAIAALVGLTETAVQEMLK